MRRLILTSPLLSRCNLVNVKYGFLYFFCFCTASAVVAVVLVVVVAVITWTALNYSTNHHRHQFHFSLNFNYRNQKQKNSNKQTNGTFGLPQCIGLILFPIKPGDILYSTIKYAIKYPYSMDHFEWASNSLYVRVINTIRFSFKKNEYKLNSFVLNSIGYFITCSLFSPSKCQCAKQFRSFLHSPSRFSSIRTISQ